MTSNGGECTDQSSITGELITAMLGCDLIQDTLADQEVAAAIVSTWSRAVLSTSELAIRRCIEAIAEEISAPNTALSFWRLLGHPSKPNRNKISGDSDAFNAIYKWATR
jgi:serine/threonine protein phosphatase PrpC